MKLTSNEEVLAFDYDKLKMQKTEDLQIKDLQTTYSLAIIGMYKPSNGCKFRQSVPKI